MKNWTINSKISLLALLSNVFIVIIFSGYSILQKFMEKDISNLSVFIIFLFSLLIAVLSLLLILHLIKAPRSFEEMKAENTKLKLSLKKAQQDSQKKSEFIASLSHEIRTPMSSIIGFTNLLFESDLTKYQKEYLITIQKSANTLLAIINDILDFSKIEAGKFKLNHVPFDLIDVLDDVLQSLASHAQLKNLELIPLISADVPIKVIGDPLRLKQILTNLVFNAIKFTVNGSVCLKVELLNKIDEIINIRVSVMDTGIGLSDKDKKNLFKAFTQADISIAGKFGGTGLGLVISKQFIEQMGGNIEIHSKVNIGTTICFNLNFSSVNTADYLIASPSKINKTILVYDSHLLSRKAIKQFLFHRVKDLIFADTFDNLKVKLAELKEENNVPDAIILSFSALDLNKPDVMEILQFLKYHYETPIIVALVNTPNETVINQLLKMGANNCVIKPISIRKLLAAIDESEIDEYSLISTDEQLVIKDQTHEYDTYKLLVVEDNPINLKLMTCLLENLGILADIAVNGKLAINLCDQKKYSLIFLDLNIPIKNGYQAAEHIRFHSRYNQSTPIIAISAYIAEDSKDELSKLGFNEFLVKPVDLNVLEQLINKWKNKTIEIEKIIPKKNSLKSQLPIDLKKAIELAGGNKNLAIEIIQMFIQEVPLLNKKMQEYYSNKDWPALKDVIHKIHGTARFCAMVNLQQVAADFENALNNNYFNSYEDLYNEIKQVLETLVKYTQSNSIFGEVQTP